MLCEVHLKLAFHEDHKLRATPTDGLITRASGWITRSKSLVYLLETRKRHAVSQLREGEWVKGSEPAESRDSHNSTPLSPDGDLLFYRRISHSSVALQHSQRRLEQCVSREAFLRSLGHPALWSTRGPGEARKASHFKTQTP